MQASGIALNERPETGGIICLMGSAIQIMRNSLRTINTYKLELVKTLALFILCIISS